jgi:predicted NUDIX family NTP pyrophosphohydrolase
MAKTSAGLMMYRFREQGLEVFLVHPGGPFWAKRDAGAWSIPKGEYAGDEEPIAAAVREFEEETGFRIEGELREVGMVRQAGGKVVRAWCFEGDCNPADLRSNLFAMEWPPKSGKQSEFPEVDRGGWFSINAAQEKILNSQAPLLPMLVESLAMRR